MNRIDSTRAIEKIWNAECKNGQLLYWNYNEECWAIKDDLKLLTKYKKAFEILKRENVEPFWRCNGYDPENTMEYRVGIGGVWSRRITKEEYELLEELMKDGE